MRKKTTEEFIINAIEKHNSVYDYSLVEYISNHIHVNIICRTHGIFRQTPASHLGGRACPHCRGNKTKHTNLEKYGCVAPAQNKNVQDKIKATNLEKYGCVAPAQNKNVQDKIKATNLEKYGCVAPAQHKEVQDKIKATNLEKYGCENPAQHKEVQDKIKATNLEKYGCEYSKQKDMSEILYLLENRDWLSNEYSGGKTAKQIANSLNIGDCTVGRYLKNHDIPIDYTHSYSKIAVQWLDQVMFEERIFIRHAGNIGEYTIPGTRYKADGYCKETNTIYEFHGDIFHGNPELFEDDDTPNYHDRSITAKELYDNTIKREELIKSLGYNLVVMWENDFKEL